MYLEQTMTQKSQQVCLYNLCNILSFIPPKFKQTGIENGILTAAQCAFVGSTEAYWYSSSLSIQQIKNW